jgi:hypothetical protein
MGIGGSFLAVKGLGREADHDLHLVLKLSKRALKGQGSAILHPLPQTKDGNVIKHRFCRRDDIKRFMWFTLQSKSVIKVG